MWFLVGNRWWPVPIGNALGGSSWLDTAKREFRRHGVPILAIAKLKPKPDVWDSDYDER